MSPIQNIASERKTRFSSWNTATSLSMYSSGLLEEGFFLCGFIHFLALQDGVHPLNGAAITVSTTAQVIPAAPTAAAATTNK